MKKIKINNYGTIISENEIGEEIYLEIKKYLKDGFPVEVDFDGVKTMATFCAKQIFGQLYVELGSQQFFEKVTIINANSEVKLIIRIGIQNSIEEQSNEFV